MLKKPSMNTCLGLAVLLVQVTQVNAQSGPIREGARRTGEAMAEGTRAAARSTREVIGRAGEATGNAVRGTTEAARAQVNRADRSELQSNAAAAEAEGRMNTDGQLQGQAYDSANEDRYQLGFRGVDDQNIDAQADAQEASQVEYKGRLYDIRHDSQGREFICVGGCPVYLHEQGNAQTHEAYKLNDEQMEHDESDHDQAYQGEVPNQRDNQEQSTYVPRGGYSPIPAPPVPQRDDINPAPPAAPSLEADTANSTADESAGTNESTDIDTEADADANAQQDLNTDQNNAATVDDDNPQE
jgi:hypothetical protein